MKNIESACCGEPWLRSQEERDAWSVDSCGTLAETHGMFYMAVDERMRMDGLMTMYGSYNHICVHIYIYIIIDITECMTCVQRIQ